jgi:hypothetical protein
MGMVKNPTEVMHAPAMKGFIDPSFDIIKPDVGPNTRRISSNGNCILPVLTASSAYDHYYQICWQDGFIQWQSKIN